MPTSAAMALLRTDPATAAMALFRTDPAIVGNAHPTPDSFLGKEGLGEVYPRLAIPFGRFLARKYPTQFS
jgi:hypothetical protein